MPRQKITPFLWFNDNAEAAAKFYVSLFKQSKILNIARFPVDTPSGPRGKVMTVEFQINGQKLVGLNGGPHYKLSPAFSLCVACDTQREIDRLWAKLSRGGSVQGCGWLTDKFGVSWQIVPSGLIKMVSSGNKEKSARVMAALMKMRKLDIKKLERAAKG